MGIDFLIYVAVLAVVIGGVASFIAYNGLKK